MMGGQGIVSCKICGSVNLVDPEPKRDFYADREAMNQRDQEILHTLGIKS